MRQVVERITCDIGGEYGYSDSNDTLLLGTYTFTWLGTDYEYDACGKCQQQVGTWSIHALIEKARKVSKQAKSPAKPKRARSKSATPGLHDGDAPEVTDDMHDESGRVKCPACGNTSPSERGFKMHWATQRRQESEPLGVAV